MSLERLARLDPRLPQIGALASLLLYGMVFLSFDVTPGRVALLIGTALAAQLLGSRLAKLPSVELRSALISGLSLCLLLRTNSPLLAVATAVVTIASKFALRWNGKHVFNPTNFGLVAMRILTDRVWVSPGQWGTTAFFAFAIACAGILVVRRAARSDVTLAFLGFYALLLFSRSLALGEPLAIPLHRLESGALLLFAFFMISDPKTTPDSRPARILFALLVAGGAAFVQFRLFRTNGLLWSLAVFSLLVPLVDRIAPADRYRWASPSPGVLPFPKGVRHEPVPPTSLARIGPFPSRAARPSVLRFLRREGGCEALQPGVAGRPRPGR
jgi:Na+-translocating ferredoxin:NAD+ oxidoreductase RnfD subunit